MTTPSTIECTVHFHRRGQGARKELQRGAEPLPPPERIPRLARLLALAHRFETLLQAGAVKDYATLARLGVACAHGERFTRVQAPAWFVHDRFGN